MTSCFFAASADPADTVSAAAANTSAAFFMIYLPVCPRTACNAVEVADKALACQRGLWQIELRAVDARSGAGYFTPPSRAIVEVRRASREGVDPTRQKEGSARQ